MIDLSQSPSASPLIHAVATNPGLLWTKDAAVAIEAPLDVRVIVPEIADDKLRRELLRANKVNGLVLLDLLTASLTRWSLQ